MNEAEFTTKLCEEINKVLSQVLPRDYSAKERKNLLYKLIVDPQGKVLPRDTSLKGIKRGNLAFQVDILIKKKEGDIDIPLVAVEVKYGGFTTHNVLTYCTKALRHKEVYPWLKYGLIIGGKGKIDKRFFTHNSGFDFALATIAISNLDQNELRDLIYKQIKVAEQTLGILLKGKPKVRKYESIASYTTE
jgi:hypothetical protein